jgi:S-adenosylmethionine decarboxylase
MGDHYLLNLYGCNPDKLNDEKLIKNLLHDAAYCANMTVLNTMTYKFYPQGVTGVVMLAESHISIHTWPEEGKAAVDVYTCGSNEAPLACSVIRVQLEATDHTVEHIKR